LSGIKFSGEVAFQLRPKSISQRAKGDGEENEKRCHCGMLEELKEVWCVFGVKFGRKHGWESEQIIEPC